MKNFCVMVSVLIVAMLLLSLTGCDINRTTDAPPAYKDYSPVFCLPMQKALQKLNLSESDLRETTSRSYYDTGRTQKICGVDFEYQVAFWPIDGVDRLYRVQYQVILDDPKQAADTALAIAKEITDASGTAVTHMSSEEPERLVDTTPEELVKLLKTGKGNITDEWFLGDLTTEDAKAYMAYVVENGTVKPDDPSDPLGLMVSMNIAYALNADKTVITLTYEPMVDKSQFTWN